jgi:RNA polymerase sigma-70 factor (ECF subfamily)
MTAVGVRDDAVTSEAVENAFREDRAIVLAALVGYIGDLQLAEDALQDAFVDALATWPRDGIPSNRRAWLIVSARRRAIDRVRRRQSQADRGRRLAALVEREPQEDETVTDDSSIPDDGCACCSPAVIRRLTPPRAWR